MPPARRFAFTLFSIIAFTALLAPLSVLASSLPQSDPTTPTPFLGPLGTPLPTPRPVPAVAWRPPPYPVPWALTPYDHFYFSRPIAADEVNWPLADYRYTGTNFGEGLPHTGVDIVAAEGTPVLAAEAGQVVWADWGLFRLTPGERTDPYGQAIVIAHDFGFRDQPLYTVYAHLSEINVIRGQMVQRGEAIGKVGDTGIATAAHLHFEVRWGQNDFYSSLNPELWLAPPQDWGVLAARIMTTWGDPVFNQRINITNMDTRQRWWGYTYSTFKNINRDPYLDENFVVSDLPAGNYEIEIPYVGRTMRLQVRLNPGTITFFTFYGFRGFNAEADPLPIPTTLPIYLPPATP